MEMQYYYACGRLWFMMSRRALSQVRLINLAVERLSFMPMWLFLQFYNAKFFRGKGSDVHNYRDHLDGQLTPFKIGMGLPVSIRPIETQPSEILNWHNFWKSIFSVSIQNAILGPPKHVLHLVPSPDAITKAFNVM